MHLPFTYLPDPGILRVDLGSRPYYFIYSIFPVNHGATIYIAKHKYAVNKLLERSGFPVAKSIAFKKELLEEKSLEEIVKHLKFPLVAKPMINTVRGRDVLCNIKNIKMLTDYLIPFFKKHRFVQVEEFRTGLKEYRVLVLNNRVIGVIERTPAFVLGDGIHNIEQLIELKNVERIRLSKILTISPLKYDIEYKYCLDEQGLSLQSIPKEGEKIRLCYTVNTGRGGDILSQGKKIHSINAKHLCNAAQAIGLNYVGFDLLCEDINKPFKKDRWLIIEANYCADATLHEIPNHGVRADVINKVLKRLIYRHPLSYLCHLCIRSPLSFYFKSGLLLLILIVLTVTLLNIWKN